ncbi:pimeloyl-ACP methyl ester carboxylesterase [Microbacterium phyllosphaerae]|uniref:Pimeloyl-ACP methyl ester carboxylesterase n=1 Tax=Microbacterium phyllosphaerae TaxID=124798 RepID=A0ABS4WNZ6_9MICO|nr:alpha/beta hydrolase [Microbacterium phyllosphaerae]MBP2377259.1 pimeloyl-ACP methyl ester carboxylesterase [Microbacterium phyllosphaerae]
MVAAVTRTPVVLVHGWAGSAESWRPIQDALPASTWDAVAVRLPGSPGGGPGPATIAQGVRMVVDVLEGLASPAVLVGHSMGAQVTMLAHGHAPDLVQSEVVVDAAYAGAAESRQNMADWATAIEREGLPRVSEFFASATVGMLPGDARRVLADLHDTAPAVIASYLRSEYVDPDAIGLSPATEAAASARRRPVLSLHSTLDSVQREASLHTPPGSASQLWEGYGHYLHLEDPQRFVRVLDEWRNAREVQRSESQSRIVPAGSG